MNQKKIMLYVHDGSGLGHLRRIARIALELQGPCATLIVTGQKDALWIIDDKCEFIYLPGWDSLSSVRASYWNKPTWLDIDTLSATNLRSSLFNAIVGSFKPDAIIVDYLPLGKNNEIELALNSSSAKKYLIHRGIIDSADNEILTGKSTVAWEKIYDRVLVTADKKIVDVAKQSNYTGYLASKVTYVGYVIPQPPNRMLIRAERGITDEKKWVVCSSGGGIRSEYFLLQCIKLAEMLPWVTFDVVIGPRTKIRPEELTLDLPNLNISFNNKFLPALNASCDIAVVNGGYNSTMEAISGGASILVYPNQIGDNDEQKNNATQLSQYYPISIVDDIVDLPHIIEKILGAPNNVSTDFTLNKSGTSEIRKIVLSDLGFQ